MIKKITFYLALTLLTSTYTFAQQWRQLPPNANMSDAVSYDIAVEDGGTFYAVYAMLNAGSGYYDLYFDYYNTLDGWQNLLVFNTTNNSPLMNVKVVSFQGAFFALAPTNNASRMTLFQMGGLSAYQLVSQDFAGYSVATVGENWNFFPGSSGSEVFLTYTSSSANKVQQFDYNTQTWLDRGNPFAASGILATNTQLYADNDSVFVAAKYNTTPANRIKLAGAARSNWTWSLFGSPFGDVYSYNGVADTVTGNDPFYLLGDVQSAAPTQEKFVIAKDNGVPKEIPVGISLFGNGVSFIDYDAKPDMVTAVGGHYFLARTPIAGAENAVFQRDHQSGGWTQQGLTFANDAILPVDKRLAVSNSSGRLMVGYVDQAPTPDEHVLLLSNMPPTIADEGFDFSLLCGGNFQTLLSEMLIEDPDGDYITFIGATSTDNTLIDPADISVNIFNNGFNPAEVYVDAEIGTVSSPQTVTVTFSFSDGFDQVQYSMEYTVQPTPTVAWTDDTLRFCNNGDLVDLYDYVTTPGGDFSAGESDYEGHYYDPTLVQFDPINFYFDLHYSVDNGACYADAMVTIGAYPAPEADLVTTPATNCGSNDGMAEVDISNGTEPYVFIWNNGNYTDQQLFGLSPGMVHVDITDANGCEVVADGIVENAGAAITGVVTPVTCYGNADGAIDITVTGLIAPLVVLWSNGYSTEDVSNLQPGTHEVWITDATDCYVVQTFDVPQPDELKLNVIGSSTPCGADEGNVTLEYTLGGTAPYTYLWNTGDTDENIANAGSGIYTLTVTDANGCTASDIGIVYDDTAPYISQWYLEPATCSEEDGAIYTYPVMIGDNPQISWSNGSTEASIDTIPAGTYTAHLFNDEGCHNYSVFEVPVRAPERQPICVVTVDSTTSTNLIVWEKIGEQGITLFNIYRETFVPGQFQKIDTVHNTNLSIFNDVVASPIDRSWKYRITAVNECGVESVPSIAHKTIHLSAIDLGNGDFKVVWNFYEGTSYNAFNVYRFTNSTGWEQIATTPAGQPYFIDTPPNTAGLDYMVDFEVACTADLAKAQDFNSARSNKDKGQFSAGNGTGDSHNGLIETNLGDGTVYLYPNPVSGGKVFVEMDNIPAASYTIVSVTGQTVASGQLTEGVSTIGLEPGAGMYIMHLVDGDNHTSLRFIVQ